MKTIAWRDKADPRKIMYGYACADADRATRLQPALSSIKRLGNIEIYLIKGSNLRTRKIGER